MIPKPLRDIDQTDILVLVNDGVREEGRLEYKLALPGSSDGEKKEFCADVTAMANSIGGDIIYGIREGEGEREGVPVSAVGVTVASLDQEERRLRQILQSGVRPRLASPEIHCVDGFDKGSVLVLRVQAGWDAPHMVVAGGSNRFFTRRGAGKQMMDVDELRAAFAARRQRFDALQEWRSKRLETIRLGRGVPTVLPGPKVVVHVIPLIRSASETPTFALEQVRAIVHDHFHPVRPVSGSYSGRPNYEGYIVEYSANADVLGCCQVFRNGRIETVRTWGFTRREDGSRFVPSQALGDGVIYACTRHIRGLAQLGIDGPFVVLVSLLDVEGVDLAIDRRQNRGDTHRFDRDPLELPDVLLRGDEDAPSIARALRPAFDVMWNAAGLMNCLDYDDNGDWSGKLDR